MSQFLYFAAGTKQVTSAAQLTELGVGHIEKAASRESASGPNGLSGCVFGPSDDLRYVAKQQTWRRLGRCASGSHVGSVYVGVWNDRRPIPSDLQRATMLDGEHIRLLDGNDWLVPQLRQYRDVDGDGPPVQFTSTVPRLLDVDDDGDVVSGEVVPTYRSVYQSSLSIADDLFSQAVGSGEASLEDDQILCYVGDLIATNYHAHVTELILLGAISPAESRAIIQSSIDWGGFTQLLGKLQSRDNSGDNPTEAG